MIRHAFAFLNALLVGQLGFPSAQAQQPVVPRHIGFVLASFSPQDKELEAFRDGLRDAGYAEGHDVVIDWRFAGAIIPSSHSSSPSSSKARSASSSWRARSPRASRNRLLQPSLLSCRWSAIP